MSIPDRKSRQLAKFLWTMLHFGTKSAKGNNLLQMNNKLFSKTKFAHDVNVEITKCYWCKTKYKMSPSSVRSEGGEAAAGYCLNSVRVDEAVKYNVLNSD